jgi:NADH-quinone oxidoreductase subunit L
MLYFITIFAPILGSLLAGTLGQKLSSRFSEVFTCVCMFVSVVGAIIIFNEVAGENVTFNVSLIRWIEVGNFRSEWSLYFDTLSSLMVMVVAIISFLVHVYSIGYMRYDPSSARFMAYLSLFTFMMFMLVVSSDFLQLFFGWEGVGLSSYLLIGFWYEKNSAHSAALKAFIVNRAADLGLILAIAALYSVFGTLEFKEIFITVPSKLNAHFLLGSYSLTCVEVICLLLFLGAIGKSAQLGFHVWLPDAMEGPTPVSALIHAATMVTAGVFLVARCSPLYHYAPMTSEIITFIGATTAFFAGTIALTQNDIKRIIAYSTCSQLGYMFIAAGLYAYNIAIFHLVTHAFFKALLFLGAGAVIHSMSDEQDIRSMGGIWRLVPLTYVMMLVGSISLAGIPYFSGYYSKDAILEVAWNARTSLGTYAYVLGIISVFLTSFYAWRLLCLTFTGKPRANEMVMSHIHEVGLIMIIPLFILAIGAIFTGYFGIDYFFSKDFWGTSLIMHKGEPSEHITSFITALPTLLAISGIIITYILYGWAVSWPTLITQRFRLIYQFLYNKYYFDEIYERFLIKNILSLGRSLWQFGDIKLIDKKGPEGIARLALYLSNRSSQLQTGYIFNYVFVMIGGVALLVAWFIFKVIIKGF